MVDLDLTQVLMMPWAIPVVMGCGIALVAIIGSAVSGCITKVTDTNLKRSMVERGFSAAEIEQVVRADPETPPSKAAAIAKHHTKPTY